MAILRKCCFCFELTTGAVILGWVLMILSTLSAVVSILCLANHRNILIPAPERNIEYAKDYSTAFNVTFGVQAAIHILMAVCSVLLIIGAMKRKTALLMPFLVVFMIYTVLVLILSIITATTGVTRAIVGLVGSIINSLWYIYWWLCVYSLYQNLKEDETRPRQTFMLRSNQGNPQQNMS